LAACATTTVDVRVLVATNRNLDELVRAGRVREDLLHRVDVVRITLPPLRDRPDDVPRFVQHFMEMHRRRAFRPKRSPLRLRAPCRHTLGPGNVRELANTIERLMILAPRRTIDVGDLPEKPARTPRGVREDDLLLTLEEVERRHVQRVLETTRGNRAAAARQLGLDRGTLNRKLKQWNQAQILGESA